MLQENQTVCAVVVTYNRKNLLIECLQSLLKQTRILQGIYIIDNASTDETPRLLTENGYIAQEPPKNTTEDWETELELAVKCSKFVKIHYLRSHKNTGGAGGFYEGVKRAFMRGYDWLWLMDDDVQPELNCLEQLLSFKDYGRVLVPMRLYKQDLNNMVGLPPIEYNLTNPFLVGGMCEKRIDRIYHSIESIPEMLQVAGMTFEGPLIHRDVIQEIGFPEKKLFLFFDDLEYSIRAVRGGYGIYLIKKAFLYRKIQPLLSIETTWRDYYAIRNNFWLDRKYGKNCIVRNLRPLYHLLGRLIKGVKRRDFNKIRYALFGYIDSFSLKSRFFPPA